MINDGNDDNQRDNEPDVVNPRDVLLLCDGAELPLRLIWQVDIFTLLINIEC